MVGLRSLRDLVPPYTIAVCNPDIICEMGRQDFATPPRTRDRSSESKSHLSGLRRRCYFPDVLLRAAGQLGRGRGPLEPAGPLGQAGGHPQAAAASPSPKDGDVEMLFEEHFYKLDEQGRQQRVSRRVYRLLTEKGVDDWSCTEADWSPWCEEKPIFRVRVITPDGQAHALDQESIGEAPAGQDSPNMFSDDKLLRGPLPAVVVGAVVEEEIETHEVRSLFDHGIVERFLLGQQYPVRKLRLTIEAPSTLPLKYEVLASDAKPVRTEDKGRVSLVFELGPLPAMDTPEDYLPAEAMKVPQVVFSTGTSWNDVATVYAGLVESHLDIDVVRPLVEKATAGKLIARRSLKSSWPRCGARSATRAWSSARARLCRGRRKKRWPAATATARTRRRCWWRCSAWPAFGPTWLCCGRGDTRTWCRRCRAWATSIMPSFTFPASERCGLTLPPAVRRRATCR